MYNTGNPVPSDKLEDMADNAQTFDALVTKTEGTTTDRLGRTRRVFQQIIMDMGFQPLSGSFQTGATITARNQKLYDEVSHVFYAWGGVIPDGGYVVPAGSTPSTAGGVGAGAWSAPRSELNSGNGYVSESITPAGDTAILDLTTAAAFRVTLNAHVTHITFTNASGTAGSMRYITIVLRQGTGVNLVEWPSNIRWSYNQQPVLAYEKDYEDVVTLMNFGTDGYWYGFLAGGGFHV